MSHISIRGNTYFVTKYLASFAQSGIVEDIGALSLAISMSSQTKNILRTVGIIYLLVIGQSFFIPLAIGLFLGLILSYCIDFLEQKGVKNIRARIFVMIGFIALLLLCVYGILNLFRYAQNNLASIQKIIIGSWDIITKNIADHTPLTTERIHQLSGNITDALTIKSAESIIGDTFTSVTNLILVLVYTVLIPIYKKKIILLLNILSPKHGEEIFKDIQYTVTKYTQGLFGLAAIVAGLYFLGLTLFNVPYAPLIAISSALTTLVPTVGTFIGGVGAIVASSLLTGSIKVGASMLVWYIGIQFLEEYLILPYVVGKKVALNVFVAILTIVAGGLLRGVAGIFLAMPVLGVVQKFLEKKEHPLYEVIK